jgi:hypothetical protein
MATIPLHGDAYIKQVHGFEKPSKIERNEQEHLVNLPFYTKCGNLWITENHLRHWGADGIEVEQTTA